MSDPLKLRFHQHTFDVLQETPVASATNIRLIETWERKNKVPLPGALREWYSLDGAEGRGSIGASGEISPLSWILDCNTKLQRTGRIDLSKKFYISQVGLYHEDCTAFARYDGTDDPPVVERLENVDRNPFGGKRLRFSAFVFRWAWRLLFDKAADRNTPVLHATETEVGPIELDFLLDNLTECFRARHFRGRRQMKNPFSGQIIKLFPQRFAFRHRCGLVSLQCQANPAKQQTQANWLLLGHTEVGLFELAKLFWACGDFSKTLTAGSESGNAVLARLHRHYHTRQ
jgi:hypothetical protein